MRGGLIAWVFLSASTLACGSDFEPATSSSNKDAGGDAGSSGSGGTGAGGTGGGGTSGSPSGGSGGTDSGTPCPGDHACVAVAPTGWNGPFALSKDAACAGSFTTEELVLHADLVAPAAECDCACTPTVDCPAHVTYTGYTSAGCADSGTASNLAFLTCKVPPGVYQSTSVKLPAAVGKCTAAIDKNVPDASWGTTHRLCKGAPEAGECSDPGETCLPKDGGDLCISHADSIECPSSYPTKLEYFQSLVDTRDCPSACGCTPGGTPQCLATAFMFPGPTCTATPPPTLNLMSGGSDFCSVNAQYVGSPTVSKPGTCTGDTVTPLGSATPTGAVTVCCQ
jgi:hypothetical protein